ncbi:MAG: ABC transporter ATP-binding protein [Lachnospirales bacterium]
MLNVKDINVSFRSENQTRIFGVDRTQVLYNVNANVEQGKCLGILGESGSGKSTLGRVICGLLKPDSGKILIDGHSVYEKGSKRKGDVSVVFQDYTTSLNPRFTVKQAINEGLDIKQRKSDTKIDRDSEIAELLKIVSLPVDYVNRFPHELSGGQRQRVAIARAIATDPSVIIFDEAISSLDMHTGVQIMDILDKMKKEKNLTYVFITHDLTSITYLCDDVLFLHKGKVEEVCKISEISKVKSEYANMLLHSVLDEDRNEELNEE